MKIRFVSRNMHKIAEVQQLLRGAGVEIIAAKHSISEIQTEDVNLLVRDKILKAFAIVGRPVFVEHTGLYIEDLNHFPGGLTQIFWDKLQADKFCELFGQGSGRTLIAKTVIAYCDSMKVHLFEGQVNGTISAEPRGCRDFQWDCVFVPDGGSETYAEMGLRKNEISMRKIAFDQFRNFLDQGKR
jgi:XTP/dITP diphosphohydrolase